MGQGHASDFEILRANPNPQFPQPFEVVCSWFVPASDFPIEQEIDQVGQVKVWHDLPVGVSDAMNLYQPAAQMLLNNNDGKCS